MPRMSPTARSSPTRTRSRMQKIDPLPNVWTGTWRDARFSPPGDGGRPENALTGTIFMGNCCGALPLTVSAAEGQLRFWRNTPLASLAAGTSATIATGIVGYEFDADLDNGFRPSGLMRLSTSTLQLCQHTPGRRGSLRSWSDHACPDVVPTWRAAPLSSVPVPTAGPGRWTPTTIEDSTTPGILLSVDPTIQQATVNLLADMNVQPLTLQAGLSCPRRRVTRSRRSPQSSLPSRARFRRFLPSSFPGPRSTTAGAR